jgi:hypothetical protein
LNFGSSPLCARPAATCWRCQIGPPGWPRPAALTRRARSPCTTARMLVRQAAQPGHFLHSEAAAAPFDRLTHGQALVGHRQQRAAGAQHRVPDWSRSPSAVNTSTANASSRRSRSARCLRSSAWAFNSIPPRYRSSRDPSHRRGVERSPATISSCVAYPQSISRSDVPHTFCIIGTYPHLDDREVDPVRLWWL